MDSHIALEWVHVRLLIPGQKSLVKSLVKSPVSHEETRLRPL